VFRDVRYVLFDTWVSEQVFIKQCDRAFRTP